MDAFKYFDVEVPAWVMWIAQDASGEWWGYSVEPLRKEGGWYENEVGQYIRLGQSRAECWQHSLQKIGSDKN